METQIIECIVHNRKYISKFHANINQLRRTNEFNPLILQKLPKQCCSCHGKNGESLFDLDHLRKLCLQIQLSQKSPVLLSAPEKPIHYVILEFPPTFDGLQCFYKAGRFVGGNGQNLRLIERTLNISIHIVNAKSTKYFRQIVDQLKQQNKENSKNALWLLINMKNDEDDIEKIKLSLQNQWKKINVTPKKKRSEKIRFSGKVMLPSTNISGDTRWKPKKQKARDKYKSKHKQYDEQEEIQPQPLVRPISMPKEIINHQKTKRK